MYPWCVYSSHRLLSKLFIIRGMCFSNNFGRTGGFDLVEINFFFLDCIHWCRMFDIELQILLYDQAISCFACAVPIIRK